MSNWKKTEIYCRGCQSWRRNIIHKSCPKAGLFKGPGGQTWINIPTNQVFCEKCNHTWPLESNTYYCSCGHIQKTYYTDSALIVEATDQIVATDGDLLYVLKKSGAVVVGYRTYPDFG